MAMLQQIWAVLSHAIFERARPRSVGLAVVLSAAGVVACAGDELGHVRGVVHFAGEVPKAEAADDTGQKRDLLQVHARTGGLAGAVVYWADAPVEAELAEVQRPSVSIDQKDFTFLPHVISVRSGQPVKFTNSDSANHNVRTATFDPKNQFNVFTGTGREYVHRFVADKKHRPIRLGCDIHAWMSGWIYVFDHPHHAVTDDEGRFELPQLPGGKIQLAIRQPDGNLRRDVAVEVRPGQTTSCEVNFRDTDLMR
jgi:plastocyanin